MSCHDCSVSRALPSILSALKLLVLHDLPDEAKTVFQRSNNRNLTCTKSKTIYFDLLPFLLEGPADLHFQGNQRHQVGHRILGNQVLPAKQLSSGVLDRWIQEKTQTSGTSQLLTVVQDERVMFTRL